LIKVFGKKKRVITFAAPKGKNVPGVLLKKGQITGENIEDIVDQHLVQKKRLGADFL
jgi:aspartate ammonia-lyase